MALSRPLRRSLALFLVASGLLWLPLISRLADAQADAPPEAWAIGASALANLGLGLLIGLNLWLRRRKP